MGNTCAAIQAHAASARQCLRCVHTADADSIRVLWPCSGMQTVVLARWADRELHRGTEFESMDPSANSYSFVRIEPLPRLWMCPYRSGSRAGAPPQFTSHDPASPCMQVRKR